MCKNFTTFSSQVAITANLIASLCFCLNEQEHEWNAIHQISFSNSYWRDDYGINEKLYDICKIREICFLLLCEWLQISRCLFFIANGVNFHNLAYLGTSTSKKLSDVGEWTAATDLLIRLHGALMLASWLGTASIGMLLARYYRQTWVNSQLCGKDHWFAVSEEFSDNHADITFNVISRILSKLYNTMLFYTFYTLHSR